MLRVNLTDSLIFQGSLFVLGDVAMEGLWHWGLTYCGTNSLHAKLLTGNGKGGIKAQEYTKNEGEGKEMPATTLLFWPFSPLLNPQI